MRKYRVPDVSYHLTLPFWLNKLLGYLEAAGGEGTARNKHEEESARSAVNQGM